MLCRLLLFLLHVRILLFHFYFLFFEFFLLCLTQLSLPCMPVQSTSAPHYEHDKVTINSLQKNKKKSVQEK